MCIIVKIEEETKKTTLRLPATLARQLKVYCAKKDISQTEMITRLIKKHMNKVPETERT